MSETYGMTGTGQEAATRGPGGFDEPVANPTPSPGTPPPAGSGASTDDTKAVAKDEVRATSEQAKDGARHVAEVGKDEAKNVARETSQQAKQLWGETRNQLLDQSSEQQVRVAAGLRSLSEELSGMAGGSAQQGVASDLAHQASQRLGEAASWLDDRDPGSLVSEVKQFARQRPTTFLAAAAVLGLVGGRLSRGLVAEHHDQDTPGQGTDASSHTDGAATTTPPAPTTDHSTAGYSAYGSPAGAAAPAADRPVSDSSATVYPMGGAPNGSGVRDAGTDPR